MSLQTRLEPWHGLLAVVFLFGATITLLRVDSFDTVAVVDAVGTGLLWAFLFHIVAGTLRNYVAEYADTGGSLLNPRFLAPFVVAAIAAAGTFGWLLATQTFSWSLVGAALWAGFWVFVAAMAAVLVATYALAGYREGTQ